MRPESEYDPTFDPFATPWSLLVPFSSKSHLVQENKQKDYLSIVFLVGAAAFPVPGGKIINSVAQFV